MRNQSDLAINICTELFTKHDGYLDMQLRCLPSAFWRDSCSGITPVTMWLVGVSFCGGWTLGRQGRKNIKVPVPSYLRIGLDLNAAIMSCVILEGWHSSWGAWKLLDLSNSPRMINIPWDENPSNCKRLGEYVLWILWGILPQIALISQNYEARRVGTKGKCIFMDFDWMAHVIMQASIRLGILCNR
jgi:hypothetical protein